MTCTHIVHFGEVAALDGFVEVALVAFAVAADQRPFRLGVGQVLDALLAEGGTSPRSARSAR
jgi:hypothetical protein